MDPIQFKNYLEKWEAILPALNVPFEAWGKRKVDISDPHWMEKLAAEPNPFDTDNQLREQFLLVTKEMADVYLAGNNEQCVSIRKLLNNY